MKKVLITTIAVFAVSISGMAQKFIDVYQGDKIVGTMLSSDIDSVSITGTDVSSRKINFWHDGNKTNSYIVNTVHSIKVFHSEDEPLVYLGILGFNQDIYPKAIDVLATSTSNLYSNFIKSLIR